MTRHDPDRGMRILTAIEDFTADHGYPPSVRDIMPVVGLASPSAVVWWIKRLERDGRVVHDAKVARSLRVLPEPQS